MDVADNRALIAAGAVLVVLAVVGLALATGFGPAPGGDGSDVGTFPTETASDGGGGGDGGGIGDAADGDAPLEPQFRFQVIEIESCGSTCRDVTGALVNDGGQPAEDVTVYSRIFVGNSTDESDQVWEGSEEVGDLGAGESYESTQRVEISYQEGLAIQQADGWITVQTTVQTADRTVTFSERRNVS